MIKIFNSMILESNSRPSEPKSDALTVHHLTDVAISKCLSDNQSKF